ncbi:hypothetical protein [uncultured Tistrella sp.]|nr:hypothetical protein [uncultured Tistrella sp.]
MSDGNDETAQQPVWRRPELVVMSAGDTAFASGSNDDNVMGYS